MRTVIIEDNAILREGLSSVLEGSSLQVVAVCSTVIEGLHAIQEQIPDIVIIGARLARAKGYEAIEGIRRLAPQARIIITSVTESSGDLIDALGHGVSCFLSCNINLESLLLAAEAARQGLVMADTALFADLCRRACRHLTQKKHGIGQGLTIREWEVLQLLGRGMSNGEIANHLNLTPGTVRTHVSSILRKLGVTDRVQAAVWAAENLADEDRKAADPSA